LTIIAGHLSADRLPPPARVSAMCKSKKLKWIVILLGATSQYFASMSEVLAILLKKRFHVNARY
jgi:hypothetical protein